MSVGAGTTGESRRVRVGVVGAGEFGRNHARVYREVPDVELAGVFDQDAARAAEVAKEFHTRSFRNIEELRGAVDAASVAVPTVLHAEIGCQLLEMGIDALIEKPMASTLAEADRLLEAAKRHKRILQVGHVERFNPAVLAVEPIVQRPLFF
jgi:predicted dehydrogenase